MMGGLTARLAMNSHSTATSGAGTAIPATGLTAAEATRRLAEYGSNHPARSRQRSTAVALLLLFLNPLAVVLLIAAVFSAFLGQVVDAVIIVSVVTLGNAINF
jgi:magnesium-transporting ATPase (P-type)